MNASRLFHKIIFGFIFLEIMLIMGACTRIDEPSSQPWKAQQGFVPPTQPASSEDNPYITNPRLTNQPILTPTPDTPHPIPGARTDTEQYVVQAGDTLGQIATRYGVSVEAIAEASELTNTRYPDG